jgi:Ca-activated chloride channel family protein
MKKAMVLKNNLLSITLLAIGLHSCSTPHKCDAYGSSSNSSPSNLTNYENLGDIKLSEVTIRSTSDSSGLQIEDYRSFKKNEHVFPEVAALYEQYNPFSENDWVIAGKEHKSTFGIDVDNASYTNFRRYVNQKQLPPKDAIRMEEWLNYFNYNLEAPSSTDIHPVKIATEVGPCPWNEKDELVMIKLQGKLPVANDLAPSNLVFLVDVSGSMNAINKLPLVQESMMKLLTKLRPQDKMSIVTYAGRSEITLLPTSGTEKEIIKKAINSLTSGGGTAGSGGVNAAYRLAEENYNPKGNNRIILATDGDWNMGITNREELKKLIEEKRKTGIFLSVLGFGMGNLNDATMEVLADNGNGNYAYIDNEREADRIFNTEFAGSMYTIAKDVKLQVIFDSMEVEQYRLIGYENRVLENWQFEADTIDAGDLGMGQNVIAFYQVKRKSGQSGSLGKIDFRYKPLESDKSILLSENLSNVTTELTSDYLFATCVVEFCLSLRESEYRDEANMGRAILRGKQNLGDPSNALSYDKRVEFVGLMEKVAPWWTDYIFEEAPKLTEEKLASLKVFPNPVTTTTTIEVPNEYSAEWSVQVLTMDGALKHVEHFKNTQQGTISMEDLPTGTYLFKIYGGGYAYGYLRVVKD